MNKFIGEKAVKAKKKTVKKVAVKEEPVEVIKKGVQEFIICPKCGWKHTADTIKCRFCGKNLKV